MSKTAKSVGPRVAKWNKEFDSLFAKLKRLDPNGTEFIDAYCRLIDLAVKHIDHRRWNEFTAAMPILALPELAEEVAAIQERLGDEAAISIDARPGNEGWRSQVCVNVWRHVSLFDPANITAEVAATLRREAAALNAMAERVDKTAK